ncbi:Ribosomal RNA large subunit methyltransferase K/L [bacterium HR36]|uniref:RNA methylase n=1 Tax=uncultured Planctomycetota bacterium TaxID=120965 RepID=H5SFS1_9BACT|nr:RNA methylase [uncultured Planctomycetota bacterium]GBD35494.1 Ribosomal RNA large subunit methyltransferase K/L [bacterium HR36]
MPSLYLTTLPGLEQLAAEEVTQRFQADVKRVLKGVVVFRLPELDRRIFRLRLAEDVFLLLWGSDQLSYRAKDLERIERWTSSEPDWEMAWHWHHHLRPKPRGKPTYHLVCQMFGEHGYRRVDALQALARGLRGKIPSSWKAVAEDAAVEIWLTIRGKTAVCGLRLSGATMRHREYKVEHVPASLRPVAAAALVWLAQPRPEEVLLDPMCGAGTILAERLAWERRGRILGGDRDWAALHAACANLEYFRKENRAKESLYWPLVRWDARRLPLPDASVAVIACNPPFGKQLSPGEDIGLLYRELVPEWHRVLQPQGRAAIVVANWSAFARPAENLHWRCRRRFRVLLLGQEVWLALWQRP